LKGLGGAIRVRSVNGTDKNEVSSEVKTTAMARTYWILAALAIALLMPATCRAQAEVSPDGYAMNDGGAAAQPALARAQPASADRVTVF